MKQNPKVSVIIPTYNCASYIEKSLESVFSQTYQDYEVIVVDSSTDETPAILKRFEGRIQLVSQPPRGVSAARNFGMQKAKGTYVAFLDGDDVWELSLLQTQVEALEKFPEAVLAFTNFKKIYVSTEIQDNDFARLQHPFRRWVESCRKDASRFSSGPLHSVLLWGNVIPTSSVVLRRKEALGVGMFDEGLTMVAEDYDYWLRLSLRYPVVYAEEALVSYLVRETGLSGPFKTQAIRYLLSTVRVLEKHLQETGAGLSEETQAVIKRRTATLRYRLGTIHLRKGEGWDAVREIGGALRLLKTVGLEFAGHQSSWAKRCWLFFKPYGVWMLSGLFISLPFPRSQRSSH